MSYLGYKEIRENWYSGKSSPHDHKSGKRFSCIAF